MITLRSILLLWMLFPLLSFAQNIGINGTGAAADGSAMLDIAAPDKGVLIPRLGLTGTNDVTTVPAAANSLLVYNTASVSDVTPGFYYWNGTRWIRIGQLGDDWNLNGNAGTNPTTNYVGTSDNQALVFRTNNTERMRITNAGLVGIGLNNPGEILHVGNGNARIGELNPPNSGTFPGFGRRLYFSGGPSPAPYNSDNSDPIWMARYNLSQDFSEIRLNLGDNCTTAQDAFVIQAGGAGCAANTPLFRFEANGNAFKPGGGAWAALSDRRLKKEIEPFQQGLATIMGIRPVSFSYNGKHGTSDNGIRYIGVIAQELHEVAPYMVNDSEKYMSVDPSALNYLLINGMQEQQEQIETLRSEMDQLKAQVQQVQDILTAQSSNRE